MRQPAQTYAFPSDGERLEQIRRLAIPPRERALLRAIAVGGSEQARTALAASLGVNAGTVSRAASRLQERGLLAVRHRRGQPSIWLIDWSAVAQAEGAAEAPAESLTSRADRWSQLWAMTSRLEQVAIKAEPGPRQLALAVKLAGLVTVLAQTAPGSPFQVRRRARRPVAVASGALSARMTDAARTEDDDWTPPPPQTEAEEEAEIAEAQRVWARIQAAEAKPTKRAPQRTEGASSAPDAHSSSRESGLDTNTSTNQDGMGDDSSLSEKKSNPPIQSHPDAENTKSARETTRARTPDPTRWTSRPIVRTDLIDPQSVASLWKDATAAGKVTGDQLRTFCRFCRAVFRLSNRERPPQYPIRDPVSYFLRAIGTGRTSANETAKHWATKIEQCDDRDGEVLWSQVKAVLWPTSVERQQPQSSEPSRPAYRPKTAEQWADQWRPARPAMRTQLMQTTLTLGLIDEATLNEVKQLLGTEGKNAETKE